MKFIKKNFLQSRLSFLLFFLSFFLLANSQNISGVIYDQDTKEPIPFTSVYFNGSFAGTISDENGRFEISTANTGEKPLSFSAVGYFSFTVSVSNVSSALKIYLRPKIYDTQEVEIFGKSFVKRRKANLRLFKREFLGATENAGNCEILNEQDITFNYKTKRDTVIAYALKPIQIINHSLGYSISYYLDSFTHVKSKRTTAFYGNIIFNTDITSTESNKNLYERRRIFTYLGSRMHFFRALWADHLEFEGFVIKKQENQVLEAQEVILSDKNGKKFLHYSENIFIYYNSVLTRMTIL